MSSHSSTDRTQVSGTCNGGSIPPESIDKVYMRIRDIHPNVKWHRLVSRGRHHAVVMIDLVWLGNLRNYSKKIYGLNYQVKYYRQFDGSRWISERDYQNLFKVFTEKIKKDPTYLYKRGEKMEKIGKDIIKLSNKYKKKNWGGISNKELIDTFEKFNNLESKLWGSPCFYGWYFFFDEYYLGKFREKLEKKIKKNFNQLWDYIITPEKITFIGEEKKEILRLAKKFIKERRIFKEDIENHLQKYTFVNRYYFWGKDYTAEQINKRIKEFAKKGEKYINQELNSFKKKSLNLDKYFLDKKDKILIKGFRKMSYTSNFADRATNYYCYHLQSLFNEIAKRLKISYEELVSMTFKEIKNSLEKREPIVSPKELSQRFKNHALIFVFFKKETYVLSGKSLKEYYSLQKKKKIKQEIKEFKGIIAFSGKKAKGKVRIIDSDNKVKNFKKEEILVTQMTNPSYLLAMQKAKAIITDEGGLLCHAAIVSRELNIPCVVGTKIATKVLKDGDLAEVDANKGIVKILNK